MLRFFPERVILHFCAGKWLQGRGTLAPFYPATTSAEGRHLPRGTVASLSDTRIDTASSSVNGNARAPPPTIDRDGVKVFLRVVVVGCEVVDSVVDIIVASRVAIDSEE